MKLKNLVILRHGDSDFHGFLTNDGRETIERLARLFVSRAIISANTQVICSDKLRALKTAQCLMRAVGITKDEEVYPELSSDDRVCNVDAAIDVIEKYIDEETLVVITHLEMVEFLPQAVSTLIGSPTPFSGRQVRRGQGFFINCKKQTIEFVSV